MVLYGCRSLGVAYQSMGKLPAAAKKLLIERFGRRLIQGAVDALPRYRSTAIINISTW